MNDPIMVSLFQTQPEAHLWSWALAVWGGLTAALVSLIIILTQAWHGRYSVDHTHGIQKVHASSVCRVGGVALALGLGVEAWQWDDAGGSHLLQNLLLAAVPVFALGLFEDISRKVSPLARLLAAFASAGLLIVLTGVQLQRTGLVWPDALLVSPAVSIPLTLFAVAGVTHAVNIIDGQHGLACFTVGIILLAFAAIAHAQLDAELAQLLFYIVAVLLGFGVFNWPWGRLFLGDGGAYLLGFAVAALALLILNRLPQVHPFALLLACFHPVFETLFSIWRRWHHAVAVSKPDRLHLHSLLLRRVVRPRLARSHRHAANAITGLLCSALTLLAALLAVLTADHPWAPLLAQLFMTLLYLSVYARIVRFQWCTPWVMFAHPFRAKSQHS